MVRRHELTEEQWRVVEAVLPVSGAKGRPRVDDRLLVNAMLYKAKTGIAWRDLPELTRGRTRDVLVRMDGDVTETSWIPLEQCNIDANGIVTGPALQEQKALHLTAFTMLATAPTAADTPLPDAELEPLMQPVLDDLLAAMARDDRDAARVVLHRYREELQLVKRSRLAHMSARLTSVKIWVSGGRAAPVELAKPVVVKRASPSEAKSKAAERASETQDRSSNGLRDSDIGRVGNIVVSLERAQLQNDPDSARDLLKQNAKLLTAFESANVAKGLRYRLADIRVWLTTLDSVSAPPAVPPKPQTPTPLSAPAPAPAQVQPAPVDSRAPRPSPHRMANRLEALLQAVASEHRTLARNELTAQLAVSAPELARLLLTIGRADLEIGSPLLAALILTPSGEPDKIFEQIATQLGYQPIGEDWDWATVQRRELERVHACYTSEPLPQPLLLAPSAPRQ
ncbi:transposase [Nocardia sp. NPDC004860]|uniref:transposase n=1 Tax=Nocardia sp. NPDC004860 TaxID=3154557 RepID=UPI0033BA53A2